MHKEKKKELIVDDRVYELCEKYNYEFPEISEQKMNLKIKEVTAQLAESAPSFQEKYVTVLTSVGRRPIEYYFSFYIGIALILLGVLLQTRRALRL